MSALWGGVGGAKQHLSVVFVKLPWRPVAVSAQATMWCLITNSQAAASPPTWPLRTPPKATASFLHTLTPCLSSPRQCAVRGRQQRAAGAGGQGRPVAARGHHGGALPAAARGGRDGGGGAGGSSGRGGAHCGRGAGPGRGGRRSGSGGGRSGGSGAGCGESGGGCACGAGGPSGCALPARAARA